MNIYATIFSNFSNLDQKDITKIPDSLFPSKESDKHHYCAKNNHSVTFNRLTITTE